MKYQSTKKVFRIVQISSNWCHLTDLDEIGHLYWPEFFWRNFYTSYLQLIFWKMCTQYTHIAIKV